MNKKKLITLFFSVLLVMPSVACSQSGDAREVADKLAKASVRTIYNSLRKEGIPWEIIRDKHMPKMLSRSLRSIRRDYSSDIIMNDFLPTLIRSYYSEVDKINRENSFTCVEDTFIVRTIVPFIQECKIQLGPWNISVSRVVDMVLNISYPYQVCRGECPSRVQSSFASAFNYDFSVSRFSRICAN
ncbi:MAG: hypothetical protein D3906_02770 [Candidatus Electrothrix sp. AUS1_2]|nr:hypothetical protein [Candidatus Electrothrix sp. AUS1_2]